VTKETYVVVGGTEHLEDIKAKIRNFLSGTGLDEKTQQDVLVAVIEGCTNALRHSYKKEKPGKVKITVEDHKAKVVFKIRDWGKKINLKAIPKPVLPPEKPGGLGIYFMETLMDKVRYNTWHLRGTELILEKKKPN